MRRLSWWDMAAAMLVATILHEIFGNGLVVLLVMLLEGFAWGYFRPIERWRAHRWMVRHGFARWK